MTDRIDQDQEAQNEEAPTESQGSTRESGRRRLLAALGLGSAALIPTAWRTPDVQGLILPSHAGTSPPVASGAENSTTSKSFFVELTPVDKTGPKKG